MLAGIVTRKNLMTFKLDDASRELKVDAMLRGWLCRDRLRRGCDPDTGIVLESEHAAKISRILRNLKSIRARVAKAEQVATAANP